MARQGVIDELWNGIAPPLPPEQPQPRGGRPRIPDRKCLMGIVFVWEVASPRKCHAKRRGGLGQVGVLG